MALVRRDVSYQVRVTRLSIYDLALPCVPQTEKRVTFLWTGSRSEPRSVQAEEAIAPAAATVKGADSAQVHAAERKREPPPRREVCRLQRWKCRMKQEIVLQTSVTHKYHPLLLLVFVCIHWQQARNSPSRFSRRNSAENL